MGKGRGNKKQPSAPVNQGVKSSQIAFDLFFAKCVQDRKLRPEQHREIQEFFRDLGLRSKEEQSVFEEALGKF